MSFDLNRSYLTIPGGLQPSTNATTDNEGTTPQSTNDTANSGTLENDDTLEEGKLIEEETEKGHS